ncbi:MAG: serine protease [Candidatus Methanoperedens sp.]|nr:serine protease [Candidatus Methanoperedens sp.]MCE8429892.1 serine protease [Candidatus Methanoperedens sp.]
MIKSGDSFFYKGTRYVIGAILSIGGRHYIAAASHIFHETGNSVQVNGTDGIMKRFLDDFDIALIELTSDCMAQITELGSAALMEDAVLMNEQRNIPCRVIQGGTSLISLLFRCFDMPQPGDSGSPIVQKGKVIGLLSSIALGNCTGTAVSSEVLRNLSFH